jgi:superfamily II DNA or RNA helicase
MNSKLQCGTEYEIYVKNILQSKYKHIWLWNQVPYSIMIDLGFINNYGSNCDDIGCDLIAQTHDNIFHYIQCKNYTTTGNDNTIYINDLSGFYNFVAENSLSDVSYVYYSGKLSSQVISRTKKIKYINLPIVKFECFNNKCIPRDYQIEAFNFLKNLDRGVLDMPCGTGKTLVQYLLSAEHKNTVILSPLISTTQQSLTHFKNYYHNNINIIEISSSGQRNINKINLKDKNIICSTFDSVDVINKFINKLDDVLIIFDEFHNLNHDMMFNEKSEIKRLINTNNKLLFVSATPKFFNKFNYGQVYKLNWDDAIKNKYICNYKFSFPDNQQIDKDVSLLKINTNLTDKISLINKSYFFLTKIKELDSKKSIVFLRTIEECDEFIKIINLINVFVDIKFDIDRITSNTSSKDRNKILQKFHSNNKLHIICSVHVLDEGIDIPKCDSVFLTNPNNNVIKLIQRISRCNRKDISNSDKIANVLLWTKNDIKYNKIVEQINPFIKVNKKENDIAINNNIDVNKLINVQNYEGHIISLDDVAKLFNARKGTIKDTLIKSYVKEQDYKIKKIEIKRGRPSELILMTSICFGQMCLSSKTTKANEIKKYLVEDTNKYNNILKELVDNSNIVDVNII